MTPTTRQTTTIPYFKFDTGQFLTETMGMPDDMVGMYVRMMAIYWESECSLPDDQLLRMKLGIKGKKATETFEAIIQQFFGGNVRTHNRLDQSLIEVQGFKSRQSANARARWNKQKEQSQSKVEVDDIDSGDF